MKYLISLFWGFIFGFIAIFIVSSILGSNGISEGVSLANCAILSLTFTLGVALLDLAIGSPKKN
ncbi:DUF2929 family protein [Gemelliphila palaticanis]|uniref:DUF2929 family protein n=1 Tax=Gemelliphila palaticanis TaxID=81950 RepID=A0ABX2T0L1_9BACL|nr:DUF2929 family protein [Gemella palaticanis]MBF0715243.1 DUF2929 family protein [Gemella palaticanis]NYS47173.1 DUF2929 family protein [Gemella palaticanis]